MGKLLDKIDADQHSAELLKRDRRIRELEDRLKGRDALLKQAMHQLAETEKRVEFIESFDEPRKPEPWHKATRDRSSPYCAIAVASDWHIEETVDAKKVNGLNEFNHAVAEARVRKFFLKIPEYLERYAPDAKLLMLAKLGDFISGHIHPDLAESNHMSPTQACLWFRELWNDGLATLLKNTKLPIIQPTSRGNHGRDTPKMRVTTSAEHSYEQMTYQMIARDWRTEPRVRWIISEGYLNVVPVLGRKVRFHHGDAIQYQGGVGGITIPVRKAIAQWNKSERCDLDVFGHFHEYLDGNSFIANGSLVGYGPFSVKIKAEYQPPMQAFLVFDGRHGLRQSTRIFVGDR